VAAIAVSCLSLEDTAMVSVTVAGAWAACWKCARSSVVARAVLFTAAASRPILVDTANRAANRADGGDRRPVSTWISAILARDFFGRGRARVCEGADLTSPANHRTSERTGFAGGGGRQMVASRQANGLGRSQLIHLRSRRCG